MKLGHLIEHNMKNIFLEKSYTKCGGETIPRSISKKSYLWINSLKFHSLFLLYAKLSAIEKY